MKTFPIPSLFHPLRAGLRTGLLLAAAAALVACGGGGGGGPDGGLGAGDGAGGLSLQGPVRAVANTLYSYEASVGGSTAADAQWSWGDGTQSSGSPAAKVWHMPGSFATSANASGGAASAAQNVVVVGKPISAGVNHTCALTHKGEVACWGSDAQGQLGLGSIGGQQLAPALALKTHLTNPIALGTGSNSSCALLGSGQVRCWGSNAYGQLGNNNAGVDSGSPELVLNEWGQPLSDVRALAVGKLHSCAVRSGGFVACWGNNDNGQLGTGIGPVYAYAVEVPFLSNVIALSASGVHTCALLENGTVRCWGGNTKGQLGSGDFSGTSSPAEVKNLNDVVAISTGDDFSCALRGNGQIWCWGFNNNGQLGVGNALSQSPVPVKAGGNLLGIDSYIAISAGENHVCALQSSGKALCWGGNFNGRLGYGTPAGFSATPTLVDSPNSDLIAISSGRNHTCALRAEPSTANGNSVYCWGSGANGQLGANDLNSSLSPQPVYGNPSFWK